MFGLEFLFGAALWALPLAGLPVVLHLLFRRKAPVVRFSTLRFVKLSIQQTAARKRVQRWLLLACRMLLLALLVWAVSQPARRLAAASGSGNTMAAIVVDTSYSMLYHDDKGTTLLSQANDAVRDLLHGPLAGAQVAIFTSLPAPPRQPEQFQPSASRIDQWTDLTPQPNPVPLADRVASAMDLLKGQPSGQLQLFVISDFQRSEFPRPWLDVPGIATMIVDLHPDKPRGVAITGINSAPAEPLPGVGSQAVLDLVGGGGDVPVSMTITDLEGKALAHPTLPMAKLSETSGSTQVRVPISIPAQPWLVMHGSVDVKDSLDWAKSRDHLLHVPPRRIVTVAGDAAQSRSLRVLQLALDPSEGGDAAWPVMIRPAGAPGTPSLPDVIVRVLSQWPDESDAARLIESANRGSTVMLFVQPGLEQSWSGLAPQRQRALAALLPSPPQPAEIDRPCRASVADAGDLLLTGLNEQAGDVASIVVDRAVVFLAADRGVEAVLNISPINPGAASRLAGLVWRRTQGSGAIYTWATLPDALYGNLATSPLFLPMLVNAALRPGAAALALNVELGKPIVAADSSLSSADDLEVETPRHERFVVHAQSGSSPRRFAFTGTTEPGLYSWHLPGKPDPVWWSNVQLPALEATLEYRPAESMAAGPDVVIARSASELLARLDQNAQPQSRWSGPIAVVLLLLCVEALMGSLPKMWKPQLPRIMTGAAPIG